MCFTGSEVVHFSLVATVIKYSFVFHILDDIPKAVFGRVGAFFFHFVLFFFDKKYPVLFSVRITDPQSGSTQTRPKRLLL